MKNYELIKAAAKATALEYVLDPRHGDFYWLPTSVQVPRPAGAKAGGRYTTLATVCLTRQMMATLIKSDKWETSGVLHISENVLKVGKTSPTAWAKALGPGWRMFVRPLDGDETCYKELPKDPSPCAGPRARTFEKRVCKTNGFRWTGSLRNVQIDGVDVWVDENNNVVKKIYHEVKGEEGRITAFCASAVDKD